MSLEIQNWHISIIYWLSNMEQCIFWENVSNFHASLEIVWIRFYKMFRRQNNTTTIPLVHVHKCHMKKSFHILFCCFFCNLNIVKGRSVLENEPKKLPKRKLLMFFFSRSFRIYSKCIYNIIYVTMVTYRDQFTGM